MKTLRPKLLLVTGMMMLLVACNNDKESPSRKKKADDDSEMVSSGNHKWEGKLVLEYAGSVSSYDFKSADMSRLYKDAKNISITPDGGILTVSTRFPKANYLLQIADPGFNDVRPLLDLSDGWIGGHIYGCKISPDGKYIAVSVTSWASGGYKLPSDGVYVFDQAGNTVAKFEKMYQPDWTPDGRLVMTGSLLSESSEDNITNSDSPGIFISDKQLKKTERIDPDFNDPAPCNVSVSPDGQRLAFIKNHRVWVMNADGSDARQLTASGGDNIESFPTWSPDGKYIACWVYKTFEKSYYTAVAIVPSRLKKPVKLTNEADVWPRDDQDYRVSGGSRQIVWLEH